ncbi:tetratricopeptide repeat protein [Desulfoscipio sp. XC116]|uniref:tetratricopeptide repeat protein n=1 Tax=Desulfoscipio sp. XC116 TaxID=3144975 RepID=UPI00325A5307
MKTFGLFLIISMLTRNPLLALLIIILIYVFIDRSFIGILPDFAAPLRRKKRQGELQREVEVNPHNANARMELGELYFERGDYNRAVEQLQKALLKMEDSALAHFYLGASMLRLGRAEGLKEVARAIQINPKVAQGYPYFYLIKYGSKDNSAQTAELQGNLLRYGSVRTFYEAGKYFRSAGQPDMAGRFFKEVLDIYRISSPTMRRKFRRMALYAKLFGGGKK